MGKPILNRSGAVPYKKGLYEVKNTDKYIGNPMDCIYRSSWEKRFCVYLDHLENVKKWGSELEKLVIPYQDIDGYWHKYYPDYYVVFTDPRDPQKELQVIIEIKPSNEIRPKFITTDQETGKPKLIMPKSFKNLKAYENFEYQLKTYQKNRLKWDAAFKWCKNRHIEFWLIDEKKLKELKIL